MRSDFTSLCRCAHHFDWFDSARCGPGHRWHSRGRVVEIYGPEASGKTTLALHVIAEAQKQAGWLPSLTLNTLSTPSTPASSAETAELFVSQPDTGEQALEIVDLLVRSGALDVIVIDSVAALVPKAELDGDMGAAPMGVQARLMSQALRKLTAIISKSHTSVIFLNQLRQKLGVVFGNPNHDGWECPEILCLSATRYSTHQYPKKWGNHFGSRARVRVAKQLAPLSAGGV